MVVGDDDPDPLPALLCHGFGDHRTPAAYRGTSPSVTTTVRLVAAADDLEGHAVAGLVQRDGVRELRGGRDRASVDGDDRVASDDAAHAVDDDPPARGDQSRLRRRAARDDLRDDDALAGNTLHDLREGRIEGDDLDAEPGVRRMAVRDQLRRDLLGGVSGDGEPDADVGVDRPALDLRVDADHVAEAIEERARRSCRG